MKRDSFNQGIGRSQNTTMRRQLNYQTFLCWVSRISSSKQYLILTSTKSIVSDLSNIIKSDTIDLSNVPQHIYKYKKNYTLTFLTLHQKRIVRRYPDMLDAYTSKVIADEIQCEFEESQNYYELYWNICMGYDDAFD